MSRRQTSEVKAIHSMNQGQKKRWMSAPMPSGARAPVMNQMPTPVTAPTEVVMTTAVPSRRRVMRAQKAPLPRQVSVWNRTSMVMKPMAIP